jgi:non-specific serine/threonine protein kinase
LATAGYVAALQGDREAARSFLKESRSLASNLGDAGILAYSTHVLGLSDLFNDPNQAVVLLGEAVPLYEATDMYDDYVIGLRIQLGLALLFQGEIETAEEQFDQCRKSCMVTGERWLHSYALYGLAFVSKLRGDLEQAIELVHEAVQIKRFFQDTLGIAVCLDLLAWIKAEADEAREAALLLGAASSVWDSFGVRLFGSEHWLAQRALAVEQCSRKLGRRTYVATLRKGEDLSREMAMAFVLGEESGESLEADPAVASLTRREREIAALVADGLSNKAISERLVIAQRTAEGHVENILAKFGFHSRTQIAAWVGHGKTTALPG